jgi:tetratricopeptide (TPR) repeat protein
MTKVSNAYQPRQRETICLGLLAQHEALTARELMRRLSYPMSKRCILDGRLSDLGLVHTSGRTKSMRYFVAPALMRGLELPTSTTLQRIEPHRLKELMLEDLRHHPGSSIGQINQRIGSEINAKRLKRAIDEARVLQLLSLFFLTIVLAISPLEAQPPLPERPSIEERAEALARATRFAEALTLVERAAAAAVTRTPLRSGEAIGALLQLSKLLQLLARYDDAEAKAREALSLAEAADGKDDLRLAASLNRIASIALALSRPDEAQTLFATALALREDVGMTEHRDAADSADGLASVLGNRASNVEAEAYARRALVLREMDKTGSPLDLAASLDRLGSILVNLNQDAEARPLFERAFAIREKHLAPGHPEVAASLGWLGFLHQRAQQYAEAEQLYQRALDTSKMTLASDHPSTGIALFRMGDLRQAQNRSEEAESARRTKRVGCKYVIPSRAHLLRHAAAR